MAEPMRTAGYYPPYVPPGADIPLDIFPHAAVSISPHCKAEEPLLKVKYIVLHGTESRSSAWALQRMLDPANPFKPSAHVFITEAGEMMWLVPLNLMAWHAGRSGWAGEDELNTMSIGIELQNSGKWGNYPAYTAEQIATLKELLPYLLHRFNLSPRAVLGHSDVSPHRKQDPFHTFPWKELEAEGLAAPWCPPQNPSVDWRQPLALLSAWGYYYGQGHCHSLREKGTNAEARVPITDEQIIAAFQRRHLQDVPEFGVLCERTHRFITTGLR